MSSRDCPEPAQPEKPDIMPRLTPLCQIGHDLSYHATELVAVTGEPGRDGHFGVSRMQIEDEVTVRAVGEEAPLEHQGRARSIGEVTLGKGA